MWLWMALALGGELTEAWTVETDGWNSAVAVGTDAVWSAASFKLFEHDLATGAIRRQHKTCYVADHGVSVQASGIVVVCDDEIQRLAGGGLTTVARHDEAEVASFVPGRVAVGGEGGWVEVRDTSDFQVLVRVELAGGDVTGVALSPNGQLVGVGMENGKLWLLDVGTKQTRELRDLGSSRARSLAFTPDGRGLFAYAGGFKPAMVDLASGMIRTQYRSGSWLTGAVALRDGRVVAAGSSGFVVYSAEGGEGQELALTRSSAEGIGAGGDLVCAGDRSGNVACFRGTGGVTADPRAANGVPSAPAVATPRPTTPVAAAPVTPVVVPVSVEKEASGTLSSASGGEVVVTLSGGDLPEVGQRGALSKHVDQSLGAMSFKAWVEVGRVRVTRVVDGTLRLAVEEETLSVVVNGQKKSQFTVGADVRFVWEVE